jgi:hypothetical protein
MTALPDGAASIFAVATRICVLDSSGFINPGANTFTTNTLVKLTPTPVIETGDDIAIKNAAGDLAAWAKHPDMRKYYTIALELATPDPALEAACAGGVVYTDSSVALGAPAGLTVVPQITLGTLAAATYGYRATYYNAYGESVAANDVSAVVASGTTGLNVINVGVMPAGALGVRVYGRTIGGEQLLGSYTNIGTQATSAASGTGSPTSLPMTALTKSIPVGTPFQITGDTNTTKIVFTTTAFAPVGAVTLPVSVSQSITTTIVAANLVPVFLDTGAGTPSGFVPTTDTTAGPGQVGYQEPALGIVGNPNGVSVEVWTKAIYQGFQQPILPFYRWVLPRVTGMHTMPRDLANLNTATIIEGQGYGNPNWGTGPVGDWQFDSTKVFQRARCGAQVVPAASNAPVAVLANV